ncbi:MAG: histidine triad nucleotide-binding protein [Betaproteobacteria bacterium]|nr:histidine triad nucleotide-binding protein [Betaproteobacteria bacterium]
MDDCIFCRIARGEIPARKAYEDEEILAFHDIRPLTPAHILVIPKRHVPSLAECTVEDAGVLGRMMVLLPKLARENGCDQGFRTIINTGPVGLQEVYHLHIHILGGPDPLPPMLKR